MGDQLNRKHSWFDEVNDETTYLMAEMRQESDYVTHHIQKVVAFFAAMRTFCTQLKEDGHKVIYLKINDAENPQKLPTIISTYLQETQAEKFEYQLPDEHRLDGQLKEICENIDIETEAFDTDLIIVGSQGHGAFSRFLLGSVSQSLATHADCSVMIVRKRGSKEKNNY